MNKNLSKKAAKLQRLIDLATAQLASVEGRHDEARALLAKHGIGYIVMGKGN